MKDLYESTAQQDKIDKNVVDQMPTTSEKDQSYWIFELSSDGTILHSSPHPPECSDPTMFGAIGSNFFEDISGFKDMSEIKRHFKMFLTTDRSRDIFYVEYGFGETSLPAKICFTKTFQTSVDPRARLVMMEIKGENNGFFRF